MTAFLAAEKIGYGEAALDALIGFLIVLAVLALLVGIFYLTGFLFSRTALGKDKLFERKPKSKKSDKTSDAVGKSAADGDEQTVAAIAAAITVILEEESGGESPEFVIRRVTRKK